MGPQAAVADRRRYDAQVGRGTLRLAPPTHTDAGDTGQGGVCGMPRRQGGTHGDDAAWRISNGAKGSVGACSTEVKRRVHWTRRGSECAGS